MKSVAVKAGEEAALTVELIPGASVSGHILDEDGDPLQGCVVQAVSVANPRNAFAFANNRLDMGLPGGSEYRLYGIMPGKYYLVAQCQTKVFQPRPLSSGPDPPPSFGYPKQYYPSGSTSESAQPVVLAAGEQRSGIDFQMKPVAVTHIRATLAGADWRGRKDLMWQLISRENEKSGIFGGWNPVDTSNGTFEIPQVFVGSYRLMVTSNGGFLGPRNSSTDPTIGGVQTVEVRTVEAGRPIETTIQLRSGVDIQGTIEIEGGKPPQLNQFNVQMIAEFGGGGIPVQVNDDGTFLLKSVLPGVSRLQVNAPSGFMKRAWLGNTEVIGGRIDLSAGPPGALRVVVSMNTATVRGTAPPGALVGMAFAETEEDGFRSFQTQADQNGQFTISGLAPGKYRIGIGLQPGLPWNDNEREIVLGEGDTLRVDDLTDK